MYLELFVSIFVYIMCAYGKGRREVIKTGRRIDLSLYLTKGYQMKVCYICLMGIKKGAQAVARIIPIV